jgi:glycosyltransferase involved in cell wall biosynthesis
MPLVTICIPAFNAAPYLEAAINSALRQTFVDTEILVVDNCSTDKTVEIARHFERQDSRVRLVVNGANLGMTGNFNRCLELASSTYIKFLCADDLLSVNCVETMLRVLGDSKEIALVGSARIRMRADGTVIGRDAFADRDEVVDGRSAISRCFFRGNLIGEPTAVMFRRADAARGFSAEYSQAVDLEMWFELLEKGKFAFLAESLCSIRAHPQQQTVHNVRSGRIVSDKQRLFREYASRPYLERRPWNKLIWDARMASSVAKAGRTWCEIVSPTASEVFFRGVFRWALLPMSAVATRLRI